MKLPQHLIEKAESEQSLTLKEVADLRRKNATVVDLDGVEGVERRREMIASAAMEPLADAYERYVGENDLLPINYLTIGYHQSRSVGRICFYDRAEGKGAVATGFLISEDLLVTNHHVFPVVDVAAFKSRVKEPTVDFNHEYDIDGGHPESIPFDLEPERFFYSHEELDLVIVAVASVDKKGRRPLKEQGFLVLNGSRGKAGLGDFATIIQHPQGKEKQIAIRKNEILNVELADAIVYASDTAPGSSGAPVFNDQWQVIALHSAGVPKKNDAGEYVDAAGQVIPRVGGSIDADRVVWVSNRGIRVSAIVQHLRETPALVAHPLIQTILAPAYTDNRSWAFLSRPELETDRAPSAARTATRSQPAAAPLAPAAATQLSFMITISPGGGVVTSVGGDVHGGARGEFGTFEKQYEDEQDFSQCAGFDEHFMGVYMPMPVPSERLRKRLAYLVDSPKVYTLKYHHFSTIHHALRRVPVVSGINVHSRYRYAELDAEGSRRDRWFRDNRIDYDVQLDDTFYASSGFDRGHLARREDAEWGSSVAKAKLAADMTCSYANAAPQVPALNRDRYGYHGAWGKLEFELLEKGIEGEAGKAGRCCVFAGPLFDDDEDPVFKGVQIALKFFKIVVWYDGDGSLRTTCYVLSQAKFVGEIEFEVLHFDEVFTRSQVAIEDIEAATGLTFHAVMRNSDTFVR